jgi:hypothetical protein
MASIETALPDDLPPIVGDETALAEAFAHLVANAAEATMVSQPKSPSPPNRFEKAITPAASS